MGREAYLRVCEALGCPAYSHEEDEVGDHRLYGDEELLVEMAEQLQELKESK